MPFSSSVLIRIIGETQNAGKTIFILQNTVSETPWQQTAATLFSNKVLLQQFDFNDICRIAYAAGREHNYPATQVTYRISGYSFPENLPESTVTLKHLSSGHYYQYPLSQLVTDLEVMTQLALDDVITLAYYAAEQRLQRDRALIAELSREDKS